MAVVVVSDMVGKISPERYQELVEHGRELAKSPAGNQFQLGDIVLEILPMGPAGGAPAQGAVRIEATLAVVADAIGLPLRTAETYRWVCSRWPQRCRAPEVSFTIHRILASIPSDRKR